MVRQTRKSALLGQALAKSRLLSHFAMFCRLLCGILACKIAKVRPFFLREMSAKLKFLLPRNSDFGRSFCRIARGTGRAIPSFFLLCAMSLHGQSNSWSFVAHGKLVITAYRRDGSAMTNLPPRFSDFTIERLNDRWGLSTVQNKIIFTGGTDGTASYEITVDPDSSYKVGRSRLIAATIDPGTYCTSASPYENIIWLAFSMAQDATNPFPAPWLMARRDPVAHIFSFECDRRMSSGLPEHAQFVARASKIAAAGQNEQLYKKSEARLDDPEIALKPFKEAFIGADYVINEKTNFQGIDLPLRFRLTRFNPRYPPSAPFEICEGTITKIESSTSDNLVPQSPSDAVLSLVDYRFHDSNLTYISYYATNEWPRETEPRVLDAFNASKAAAAKRVIEQEAVVSPNFLHFFH